ncbi:hypothetical protein PG985_005600 [Apiospora marii]|uniref:uncharacterized protein n=1 Tax=Apiospora marii TaxID=335849 RepID=UPI0031306531
MRSEGSGWPMMMQCATHVASEKAEQNIDALLLYCNFTLTDLSKKATSVSHGCLARLPSSAESGWATPSTIIMDKNGATGYFNPGRRYSFLRTLGLGGHMLQWSGLAQWIEVVREQAEAPNSTNEDVTDIGKWFPVVEDLVRKRLKRASALD